MKWKRVGKVIGVTLFYCLLVTVAMMALWGAGFIGSLAVHCVIWGIKLGGTIIP